MQFNTKQRNSLYGVIAALLAVVVLLQYNIDPLRRQAAIEPPQANRILGGLGGSSAALPFEYILGAVSGFRQVIAGLLWVRTDAFFHEGNYDAILPLIRVITWLDPNWLDVYATGAWHMMYNFTDTDQRSDRRYIPAGMALLKEGIANNPDVYDVYKEAAWNNFDKIKNYDEAIKYYKEGLQTKDVDLTTVGHGLAHSYEAAGRIDEAVATWKMVIAGHKKVLDDPNASAEAKSRNKQSYETAVKNLNITQIRQRVRPHDTQPPVDAQLSVQIVRTKPRVLEISGSWNVVGAKGFDDKTGITFGGPIDGARVDVYLHDHGYVQPTPKEFSFDVDQSVTIMRDQLSTRGGKAAPKGSVVFVSGAKYANLPRDVDKYAIYPWSVEDAKKDGLQFVPLDKALAAGIPISPLGQKQLARVNGTTFDYIKADPPTIAGLTRQGYGISTRDFYKLGAFKREIDMSKDPGMYSFAKESFDVDVYFNPRDKKAAPEFMQDRIGWNGEGLTDKRYLSIDKNSTPNIRMLRFTKTLTRDDITGAGRKVLAQ